MTHSEWHIHSDRMSCKDQRPEIKHSRKHGERYRKWMGSQWDRETACDVFLSFIACGQPQHNESGGSATCTRNKDQEVDLGKGRLGGLLAAERQSSLLKSFLCPRLTSYPWGPQMTSLKNKIEPPWDGKFQDKKQVPTEGFGKSWNIALFLRYHKGGSHMVLNLIHAEIPKCWREFPFFFKWVNVIQSNEAVIPWRINI